MWSLGADPALFFLVGFLIGLAAFVATVLSYWANRSDAMIRRAARISAIVAAIVGFLGLLLSILTAVRTPSVAEMVFLLLVYVAPTFVVCYHGYLAWSRRSAGRTGND